MPAPGLCALPDGSVELVNRTWSEYTGCSPQLSGWVWPTAIHPDDVAKFIGELTVALAGEKPFQTEARIRRADGHYHWFLIRKALAVSPTRGRESSLRTLIACEDIHERKQAEPVMISRPLVSVVDDDESVRESLPDLVREFGYSAQAFSSAEAFLASDYVDQTRCLILECLDVPRHVRTGSETGIVPPQARDSDHLHHR